MKSHFNENVLTCEFFKHLKVGLIALFCILATHAQAQQTRISGTVKDAKGITLPGVSVVVSGGTKGAITDMDGKFTLNVPDLNSTVIFKYVGFEDLQIKLNGKTTLNVVLKESSTALTEVVVVGYGTQKKSDVTGAIASFKGKDLQTMPQTNIQQALQGKVAGLTATASGASAEGNNLNMMVRGDKSLGGGSDPLTVIDGIIFENSFSEINPEDIESIEILKDASSAAIYGSRAANGVILITTKKGKTGKATISYNNFFGIDDAINIPKLMSGARFAETKINYYNQDAITPTEQSSLDNNLSTDWIDLSLRQGFRQQHNLSVSGGSDNTHYFLSGTINTNKGVAINDDFNRYTFRINVDSKIGKNITIGTNTQLGLYDRSGRSADFEQAFLMNPLAIPYNADGSINITPWPDQFFYVNPLDNINMVNEDYTRSVITNNFVKVDLPFVKGLSYKLNTGYSYRNHNVENYAGRNTRSGDVAKGISTVENLNTTNWLIENIVNYDRSFGKHTLGITGMYSAQEEKIAGHDVEASNFISDVQTYYQNRSALNPAVVTDSYIQKNDIGLMGRVNYSYASKYLITATVRRDGSSVFGANNKYGTFPSLALGWNISNEDFLKDVSWLESLKLRMSIGKNGNQAIKPYETLARLSAQNYLTTDKTPALGYYTNKLGDPSLSWETTTAANYGVDYSFLKGRVYGSVDFYTGKTTDLLLNRTISPVNGVDVIRQNVGETKNHGLDLNLSGFPIKKKDFSWNADFNLSLNRNKIVHVGLMDENGTPIDDVNNKWFIGQPLSVNYGYVFDGIWQEGDDFANSAQPTAKPGHVKVRDVNGDNIINSEDRTIIGYAEPRYIAGLTNTFTYKNWGFSFFIRSVQGETRSNVLLKTFFNGNENRLDREFWTPENRSNAFPANRDDVNPHGVSHFGNNTSDASFIRLQDVSLSYTFPNKLVNKIKLDRLQIFANAKNLATITDWIGLDPEFNNQTAQPQIKSFILGLRTQF